MKNPRVEILIAIQFKVWKIKHSMIYMDRLKYVSDEFKNEKIAAEDIVVLRLKENIQHLSDIKLKWKKP